MVSRVLHICIHLSKMHFSWPILRRWPLLQLSFYLINFVWCRFIVRSNLLLHFYKAESYSSSYFGKYLIKLLVLLMNSNICRFQQFFSTPLFCTLNLNQPLNLRRDRKVNEYIQNITSFIWRIYWIVIWCNIQTMSHIVNNISPTL